MEFQLKLFFVTLFLVQSILSKPAVDDGKIVFRDNNDVDSSEILRSDGSAEQDNSNSVASDLEAGNYFQGDIVLLPGQKEIFLSNDTSDDDVSRTGLLLEDQRWPKNSLGRVIVPFIFPRPSDYTSAQYQLIDRAMKGLEQHTCVRFVKRTSEHEYLKILSGRGCSSHLGMIGGAQEVSLNSPGCMTKGTVQHELIHALGYDHMHSHVDRDTFVNVKYSNISPQYRDNFDKVNPQLFGNFGTSYDLYSVMHYNGKAFSKNNKETIVPRNERYKRIMGQRIGISIGDAKRINNMYKC